MQPASFSQYIFSFAAILDAVNAGKLIISEYSRRYLTHLLAHKFYYLEIYAHVLDAAMENTNLKAGNICLVDYGCGNGLLGLFAKHCGFKQVLLCDTDADFMHAATQLSAAIHVLPDEFITGDIELLKAAAFGYHPQVMAGTDVIEHIYNLNHFFAGISAINSRMITVFTTASNPENPIKVHQLKKLQVKDETQGSNPTDYTLTGAEPQAPFFAQRKKIIANEMPSLSARDVELLAKATRGLYGRFILQAIEDFRTSGSLPVPPAGTNTCDPHTGSWTERILSLQAYREIYAAHGFILKINNGFYNSKATGLKGFLNRGLNMWIKIFGKKIAPFLTLIGR